MPTRAASRRALGSRSSAQARSRARSSPTTTARPAGSRSPRIGGRLQARAFSSALSRPELPALGEDAAHGGHVEVGGGGGVGGGEVGAECGHLGIADLVPGECPEGVPSGGKRLGNPAEDAAHGLAGAGGKPSEVKRGGMIGKALRGASGSCRRRLDGEPLDFRRLPVVHWCGSTIRALSADFSRCWRCGFRPNPILR